jgi:hypothetical protein
MRVLASVMSKHSDLHKMRTRSSQGSTSSEQRGFDPVPLHRRVSAPIQDAARRLSTAMATASYECSYLVGGTLFARQCLPGAADQPKLTLARTVSFGGNSNALQPYLR